MRLIFQHHIIAFLVLFLPVVFFVFGGCARFVIPDMPEEKTAPARAQLERFSQINQQITPYKGIGEMRFFSVEGSWSFRGAWLGVPDGMFRVETLGVAGQPGVRLICDRSECHFIYFENGCYRKISSRNRNLGRLAGIDMDVADLVILLGGGIPVVSHDTAWIEDGLRQPGPVMKLHRRLYGEVGRIHFSLDMSDVRMVEVYGMRGLRYRAEILSRREVDGRTVPDALRIEDDEASMHLNVERVWLDASYSPGAFVPKIPENAAMCDKSGIAPYEF